MKQVRDLNAVKQRILKGLLLRLSNMKFGYTYIERDADGRVENPALTPFESFGACCDAAERAVKADATSVQSAHVIYCRYDDRQCLPEMHPVLRTFERSPDVNPDRSVALIG
jgi:hypothetical protein